MGNVHLEHKGYCPYISVELGVAIKGNPRWISTYQGKHYSFAMEEAKKAFDADPERYVRAIANLDPERLPHAESADPFRAGRP